MALTTAEIEGIRRDVAQSHMGMTCVIERFVESGTDGYGAPVGDWVTHYSGQCHYWERERFRTFGATEIQGPTINVALSGPRLLLPANIDVTTKDRIASVKDHEDIERLGGYGDIREVLSRMDDVVVLLEVRE